MSRLEPEIERAVAALAKRRARELASGKPTEGDRAIARLLVLRDVRDAVVKEELPRATKDARELRIQFKTLQAALGHASPTTIQMWAKMADELSDADAGPDGATGSATQPGASELELGHSARSER